MAFELILTTTSVSADGNTITVQDNTDWSTDVRADYGLFLKAVRTTQSGSTVLDINQKIPESNDSWEIDSSIDGNYEFILYAFKRAENNVPVGFVLYTSNLNSLVQYDGVTWVEVDLLNVIDKAFKNKSLKIPVLFKAKAHKTSLVLQYVQVTKTLSNSNRDKNRLFYERTELDHFNALLIATEYSYGLSLFTEFYDIVALLDELRISNEN
jgi:hypothetical protein